MREIPANGLYVLELLKFRQQRPDVVCTVSRRPRETSWCRPNLVEDSIGLITFSGGVPTYTKEGFDTNTPLVNYAHEGSTFVTCTPAACSTPLGPVTYNVHESGSKCGRSRLVQQPLDRKRQTKPSGPIVDLLVKYWTE